MALLLSTNLVLLLFAPLDVILYVFLIQGYVKYRRQFRIPKITNPMEAFSFFEQTYKESFSQEQDGFTWGEAITRANNLAQLKDLEWENVRYSLRQYEAYRYGGIEMEQIDPVPILKLAMRLREKAYSS
jgi:hypothetical protein